MNITALFAPLLGIIKPLLPLGRTEVHKAAERAVTIPAKVRKEWQRGMNEEDIAENERLWRVAADANADALVHTASRGAIDAD